MDPWLLVDTVGLLLLSFILIHFLGKKRAPWIRSLQNKHVLITGGSRGIGLAFAMETLQEGGYVTLISNDSEELHDTVQNIIKQGIYGSDKICSKVADVSDYEAISTVIKESFRWRPVDVAICNAGVARRGYLDEVAIKDVDLVIRTNLTGVLYTVHAILPLMKQRSGEHPASLVLMGSLASLHPLYGFATYTATKHALKGLAECLRLELLPFNIRLTLSCPNFVRTPLLEAVVVDDEGKNITKIMKTVDLYRAEQAEEAREVAKATIGGIKEGSFLVANKFQGLMLSSFGRGLIPAESFVRTVMELIVFASCRLGTYFFVARVKNVIRKYHKTGGVR